MRPVVGSTWAYDESLPMFGFDGDSGSNFSQMYLDPSVKRVILESLRGDVNIAPPTSTEDIYGFGKQAARLAQIAHIANNLLDNSTASSSSASGKQSDKRLSADDNTQDIAKNVLKQALDALHHSFDLFLVGKVSDALAYDANMGGLVTVNGLRNPNADFGNGRYNDHHFHYGYLLYAAAILGKLDPSFLESHGDYVDSIYYDIAYESNFDSAEAASIFFPGARHKIWFDGHSFASGMFPFGNGKSQESSSEAVNAYYGAYLWSLVRNGAADNPSLDDSKQTDFARLLLATELRGAKTYWHMIPPESNSKNQTAGLSIYSPEFSENYMGTKPIVMIVFAFVQLLLMSHLTPFLFDILSLSVGNLGMLDALCTTWFGTQSLYVHMINLIPVTSITGELFTTEYATQEYPNVIQPLRDVDMAWRGYVAADHAIVNPNDAWIEAQSLQSSTLDTALSKSQVLYWIATRKGFHAAVAQVAQTRDDNFSSVKSGAGNGDSGAGACQNTPACSSLLGNCCPTDSGTFLNCCSERM